MGFGSAAVSTGSESNVPSAGALEKLEVISLPAPGRMSLLDTLKAGLQSAQAALEDRQSSTFGASNMGLSRLGGALVVAALCPLHGPVVRSAVTELLYKYRCGIP